MSDYVSQGYFYKSLVKAGFSTSNANAYRKLLRREVGGRVLIPRDPYTKRRLLTRKQVDSLVKELTSPNGKGYWRVE